MKRILSVLLCLAMALALVACGSSGSETTTAAPTEASHGFMVGYSKVNITPSQPTLLSGYGNDDRYHTEVLDYLYLTCVAMTDAEDNTILFVSLDLCSIDAKTVSTLRTRVNNVTGVPGENIMISVSHTHSAPTGSAISSILLSAIEQASQEAMADRKEAEMYIGTAETEGINFVRHYVMDDGSIVGDNHGSTAGKSYTGHTTEADHEMRVIQFKREGGKDVILANWQSHPHITGGSTKTSISADIVGMFRENMEKDMDCLFAYYQGAAGNINPTSRMSEENANAEKNYKVHGQMLASTCKQALANATQVEPGLIEICSVTFEAESNKEERDLAGYASLVVAYYDEGHTASETAVYAQENYGIQSIYHARAIINRGGYDATMTFEINAISLGPVGWVTAPYEMFDVNGKFIRDNSPFEMTFINGYCNGGMGYFPSAYAWEYGSYEVDTTKFARGTAELVADRFVEMLNEVYGE